MSSWTWGAVVMAVLCGCASPKPAPAPEPQVSAPVAVAVADAGVADAGVEGVSAEPPPPPGCPSQPPVELSSCTQHGLRCTYAEQPECGTLSECYLGQWYVRARGSCSPQFEGACPKKAGDVPAGVSARSGIVCVYPEGVACAYRFERNEFECSGVARALPPPAPPTYRCEAPGPAACELGGIQPGVPCDPDGVTCGASCCGLAGVCVQGEWQLEMRPCPP